MINTIKFKNYKLFKKQQTLEIKPITVLIGKNSSGKSAVLKLIALIENSLSGKLSEPLLMDNNGIELGGEFRDLIYGRKYGILEISLESENIKLDISININSNTKDAEIFSWKLNDAEETILEDKFKGFFLLSKQEEIRSLSFNMSYISSYREGLQGYFEKNRKPREIGVKGENVYLILIEDLFTNSKELIKRTSEFYKENFEGWGISVNKDKDPLYQIELENDKLSINLKEVGLGMIHALPLVVRSFMLAKEETLIVIEEPELHLHPAAHGNLAERFAKSLVDKNKRYLIETHSQNFVLRLRALIAEGKILNKDQLALYYVEYDEDTNESNLKLINIDDDGEVDYWPEDIFNESLYETIRIRKAQKAKLK